MTRKIALITLVLGLVYFSGPGFAKEVATSPVGAGKEALAPNKQVINPGDIRIPAEYGRIIETFDGGSDKLIVHIQDAHTNYEAQKNEAAVLEHLIKENGLYLILVEGGSRDVSLNKYRENGTLEERKKMADEQLKEGVIAGEEYLNIASDYPMKLQGIEDRPLYDQNMAAYLEVDKLKDEALAFTQRALSVVASLKARIYSKQLKELDEKRAGFKEEKVSLTDYVSYLADLAKSKKIDLKQYGNYKDLIDSVALEKTIDFNAVEKERADAIDALSKKIGKDTLDELLVMSVDFKSGKITQAQYHSYLKDVMTKTKIDINKYPNLEKYIRYLMLYNKIDSVALFKELKQLEDAVQNALITDEETRRLARIAKDLELMGDYINLKLAPEGFDYYQKNEADFNAQTWARALNILSAKYKLTQELPEDTKIIENITPGLKSFYDAARKRDHVFLNNTKKYMDVEGVKIAALIAGGFHTPTLMPLFKAEGISYVVVSPKVVKQTDEKLYHKILTEGWAPAGKTTPE
ncbi:MAG: hypothetical protein NTV07_03970 [Candidatus Omnitrophica bacterium]|nr:hypothetical protein [Candidatus Omnitrophota bacterium]